MSGRVVLVTGASRSMGADLAAALAADGDRVVGVGRTPVDEWEAGSDAGIDRRECDITDESSVKRLYSAVRREYGQLDLLINCAGAFSADLLLLATADRYREIFATNLVAAHVLTREAVKLMRPKGAGRVVSISSIAAAIPQAGGAIYASSKAALERLMRDFAVEFRGTGITFNSVAVSFYDHSRMLATVRPEARAEFEARLLVPGSVGVPDILGAIEYLASDAARTVTGQVITLGSPF